MRADRITTRHFTLKPRALPADAPVTTRHNRNHRNAKRPMSNHSSAQLLPPSDAGANPQPNLTVLPDPTPKRRSPFELNRAQAVELNKAGVICLVAQKSAYATKLADHGITAAFVTTLLTDITTARTRSITAVQATDGKESATSAQDVCAVKLLRGLRVIQIAARQKYLFTDPARLGDYYIGQRIDESRAVLDLSSQAIIAKATTDTLPGITGPFIASVETDRLEWKDCTATQAAQQAAATTQRSERNTLVDSIQQRRIELQFAADAAWPWNDPENAGIRREFKLPRHRPLTF